MRTRLLRESLLVLGISLGASAIWSILSILNRLTLPVALNRQTTRMNTSVTPDRPWLDLAYQLVGIGLAVVPALLALHLLRSGAGSGDAGGRRIGLDATQALRDLGRGVGLAAVVGIPGLGLYLAAKALGINTTVAAANLSGAWWTVPVLVLAALQNAVLEEVIMIGYLFDRWRTAGFGVWGVILASAVIRGTYHLYQGFGGFLGNLAMGVVFGWVYTRTKRVGPLVVAHTLLDVVAFVGYAALAGRVGWL